MLIGFSAKIGCGKTYLTNFFIEANPKYTRLSFAHILKRESSVMYDYPEGWNYSTRGKVEIINHPDLPKPDMPVREVLQWHGTEFRRQQDPNYWIKRMENLMSAYPPYVVIDDVRFKNEADFISNRNGLLVRIAPYPEWAPGEFANHQSEIDLDDYDKFDLVLMPRFGELKPCVPLIERAMEQK